jgi:thiamine-phosphate pyrophosphorylase
MRLERPIICLVTDRRRLVGGGDGFHVARVRLAELARHAVNAGVDLIQVRECDLQTAQLVDVVGDLADIARDSPTRIVVNDRLDVALACQAGGVHLRSDSIPPAAVRSMAGSGFLIGRSVHRLDEAVEHATAVDYLIAGTVFPSASKPMADRLLGESGLRQMINAVSVPVLAIGGVTVGRAARIAATGASGVAAIGLFLTAVSSMTRVVAAVRAQFDTVPPASRRPAPRAATIR